MKTKTFLLLVLIFTSFVVNAQEKLHCDQTKSSITYSMSHPLHSWTGVCKEVNSILLFDNKRETFKKVAVLVRVASFDSQNANRDSHAIEVTEAIKYPAISFISDSIAMNGNKLNVFGTLVFHGVSQKISFIANFKKTKNNIEVTGNFDVRMSQYKIEAPSLMGMDVDDIIKINFDVFF